MIFSRRRGSGRHAKPDDASQGARHQARRRGRDDFGPSEDDELSASEARGFGPYDEAEAPDGVQRLDLGSLLIPAAEGVQVQVQADPDGRVQQVVLLAGDSALQLGVLAAPRTDAIWDEVRAEIQQQLVAEGARIEEVDGDYGVELRSAVKAQQGVREVRVVGIDGPRWLVRAVFQGPAAVDPAEAPVLVECLRGLVVHRGAEAMPVREALPLRLPKEMTDQDDEDPTQAAEGTDGTGPSAGRRKPSPRPRGR